MQNPCKIAGVFLIPTFCHCEER